MPTPRQYATSAERQAAYRQRSAAAGQQALTARGVPPLPGVATIPGQARWQELIRRASILLATVQEEMQDYYDQRSETWQESERGADFLERMQAIDDAQSAAADLL